VAVCSTQRRVGEGGIVSEPNFNIDPLFDSTYIGIVCDVCGDEFDHSEYESDTCAKCESILINKIKEMKREGRI
jgi:uncharacterized CHY-type Zn-finger protein